MCNRARMSHEPETLRTRFGIDWLADRPMDNRFDPRELAPRSRAWIVRRDERGLGLDVMAWDVLGGQARWPMTNVRNLALPQWRRLAERPENRCLVPLTEFCEWTQTVHDVGGGRPIKGEMWFRVTDQPLFAVAGLWQPTAKGPGFAMVTCDPNRLVAPIHPKAMITVLDPADHERWLTGALEDVVTLQRPYDAARMAVRGPEFPTRRPVATSPEPTLL
jgi:putative SOS response-associated peptidase YedK